jgi:hypothetical protein
MSITRLEICNDLHGTTLLAATSSDELQWNCCDNVRIGFINIGWMRHTCWHSHTISIYASQCHLSNQRDQP